VFRFLKNRNFGKNIRLKKIEEHIYNLLFTHDCVTLPNFGGFVGTYSSAKFDEKHNTFSPPSKQVNFNKHLSTDDGLLTHEISKKRDVSYTEANIILKNYIESLKQELEVNKRVEISKLGTFYLDSQRIVKFISYEDNFSTKHFGLPALQPKRIEVKPINIVEKPTIKLIPKEEIKESTPIISLKTDNRNQKMNLWWVATILIPIAFYSAWIPMKTGLLNDNQQFHYSDLNPFTFQKVKKYQNQELQALNFEEIKEVAPINYTNPIQKVKLDESVYVWVLNSEVPVAKVETTFVETKQVINTSAVKLTKTYHIIGGCFSKQINAKQLVLQMQDLGYSAKILDQNKGLYRVSIGQFSKRKQAKKAKIKLKSEQELNSWILKK